MIILEENSNLLADLKIKLDKGIVNFTYIKKNGETRDAAGTWKKEIYGMEHIPKGTGRKSPDYIIKYFDIDRNEWRSFVISNLLSVGDNITKKEYKAQRKEYISQNIDNIKENIEYGGLVFTGNKKNSKKKVLVDIINDKKIRAVPLLDRDLSNLKHYNNMVYLPPEYLDKYKKLAADNKYYSNTKDESKVKKFKTKKNFTYTLDKNGVWKNKKRTITPLLLNEI